MKSLRKVCLMFLLVAIIFVAVAAPEANAASEYTIRLADANGNSEITAEPGDTVVLSVSIENNPGILAVGAQLAYPSQLSLTKAELPAADMVGMIMSGNFSPQFYNSKYFTDNPYLVWMNQATGTMENKLVTYNGKIHELTFQIADDAAAGAYTIVLSAPGDKNVTASVGDDDKILPNTNAVITDIVTVSFTIDIRSQECASDAHTWGEWTDVEGSEATCDEGGKQSRTCTTCGKIEEKNVPASHELVKVDAKPKSCTVNGNIEHYKCTACNKLFADENGATEISQADTVVARGHDLTKVDAKPRSCTEDGVREHYRCNGTCGRLYRNAAGTQIAPATWVVIRASHELIKVDAKAATSTEPGNIEYYNCTACNKNFSDAACSTEVFDVIIPATNGPVGIFVSVMPEKTTYRWGEALDTTGLVLTVAYSDGTAEEIIDGFTVTGFDPAVSGIQTLTVTFKDVTATFSVRVLPGGNCGDNLTWSLDASGILTVFGTGDMYDYSVGTAQWNSYSERIKRVVIEEGVGCIGSYAFCGYQNLSSISIANSVKSVGMCSFAECPKLTAVVIADGVEVIGESAFANCTELTELVIGEKVKTIGENAFTNCSRITAVTLPVGLTTIGDSAFSWCIALENVTIPDSVKSIGEFAFGNCHALAGIYVDADNAYYSSDEKGVLFNKYKTVLIQAPGAVSGSYAVPESVETIDTAAFHGCMELSSVSIPSGVTTIGNLAFYACESLTDVYYAGSQAQWDKISIGEDNEPLLSATIHTVEPKVTGIFVSAMPGKTIYQWGETLDTTGMTLTLMYEDGTFGFATDGFTVTGFDAQTAGIQILTVNYCDCTATFAVAVEKLRESKISRQPVSVVLSAGFMAQFSVDAVNAESYQWQYRRNENAPWINTTMSGNRTDTLSVQAIVTRTGYQYRCRVAGTDGKVHYSDPATLTVNESIIITAQPGRQIVDVNAVATFRVEAEGTGLTYQWLYRKNADDFWKVTGLTGNQTDTLSVPALLSRNGYQYRCAISDENGVKVYTSAATLSTIGFTKHPEDQTVAANTDVLFSVAAQGQELTYRWQYRKSESGNWMATGLTGFDTDTLTVAALASRDGYQYRCVITDINGVVRYSEPATLKIK